MTNDTRYDFEVALKDDNERLRKKLATARNDALDEAARVVRSILRDDTSSLKYPLDVLQDRLEYLEQLPAEILALKEPTAVLEYVQRVGELEAQQKRDWDNINIKADAIDRWSNTSAAQYQEVEELKAQLATARNDALVEAAERALEYLWQLPTEILALKETAND